MNTIGLDERAPRWAERAARREALNIQMRTLGATEEQIRYAQDGALEACQQWWGAAQREEAYFRALEQVVLDLRADVPQVLWKARMHRAAANAVEPAHAS